MTFSDYDASAEGSGSIFGAFFRLRKQANFNEFIPLKALVRDAFKVDTRELAYALVGQGYSRVDEVPQETWEEFGLAFAFEGDDKFFLVEDKFSVVPNFPLGKDIRVRLWARYADEDNVSLGPTYVLKSNAWNDLDIIEEKKN